MNKHFYTSSLAKHGSHPKAIAITIKKPRYWPKIKHMPELALDLSTFRMYKRGEAGPGDVEILYMSALRRRGLNPGKVAQELPNGSILCCWEGKGKFCHRHVLARWLKDVADVREL